ncbi:MAG: gentisate 1,2-dioxygenase [Candidatus Tectimicrobiota bacterium]|nr:MAG: gentisate 1,2-dioxygenase [Candidatus Tectomicrobia bacterium]
MHPPASHRMAYEAFVQALQPLSLAPLWTEYHRLLTPAPQGKARPHLWRYAELRPQLLRAGELVSTREAERRVLMLLNPGLEGQIAITPTLFAGMQLLLPGEVARVHRHSPAALRIIVEGKGAYTTVDGQRCFMEPGDLILTPAWSWHDHGNPGNEPVIWLDGLDLPLIQTLNVVFTEHPTQAQQQARLPDDLSLRLYQQPGLRPPAPDTGPASPLLSYKWQRTAAALAALPAEAASPYDDLLLEYTNPHTGGPVLPTMGCTAQLLRPGVQTQAHRHASSSVYLVVQGRGYSVIDGRRYDWEAGDVFVIPSWAYHEHANASPHEAAALISFTDAPLIRSLGLYREEAHPGGHQPLA